MSKLKLNIKKIYLRVIFKSIYLSKYLFKRSIINLQTRKSLRMQRKIIQLVIVN